MEASSSLSGTARSGSFHPGRAEPSPSVIPMQRAHWQRTSLRSKTGYTLPSDIFTFLIFSDCSACTGHPDTHALQSSGHGDVCASFGADENSASVSTKARRWRGPNSGVIKKPLLPSVPMPVAAANGDCARRSGSNSTYGIGCPTELTSKLSSGTAKYPLADKEDAMS